MAMATLYLTADEKKRFMALPESAREGWEVSDETQKTYERPEELKMRMLMLDGGSPGMKHLAQKAATVKAAGSAPDVVRALGEIPRDVLLTAFFTMGAAGIQAIVASLLSGSPTDEQMQALSELTQLRHMLLETNVEVPPS